MARTLKTVALLLDTSTGIVRPWDELTQVEKKDASRRMIKNMYRAEGYEIEFENVVTE